MKFSFHTVGLNKRPASYIIHKVAEVGYEGIELGCEDIPWAPPAIQPDLPEEQRKELVALCRTLGLSVSAIGGHIPMISTDPAIRRNAIDFVNACTDLAVGFGAPVNHILSGPLPKEMSEAQGWSVFVDAVSETTEYAQRFGIELAIEGVFANMFRTTDDFLRLVNDISDIPWKVNYDPSHLIVHGEDPYRLLEEIGDRIAHVHLKDGKGLYPEFTFPPLGEGDLDFERIFRGLRASGYGGWVSVEYEAQAFGWEESEERRLISGRDFCLQHLERT